MSPTQDHFSRIPANFLENGDYLDAIDDFSVDPKCVTEFAYTGMYEGRSGAICICGHPFDAHTCSGCRLASKQACACKEAQFTAYAEDVRNFFFVTTGIGEHHALGKGLKQSAQRGDWLIFEPPHRCKCGQTEPRVPVALSKRRSIQYGPSALNTFLCDRCIQKRLFPLRQANEDAAS